MGLPLPNYSSKRIGGSDHAPEWECILKPGDSNLEKKYESVFGKGASRKEAEQQAASKFLEQILSGKDFFIKEKNDAAVENKKMEDKKVIIIPAEEKKKEQEKDIDNKKEKEIAVLVDIENKPCFITEELKKIRQLDIIAFVGDKHPLGSKNFGSDVTHILSDSSRRDGTDCCMQVYCGVFLMQQKYNAYLIVSGDHFAEALADTISSKTQVWSARPAKAVTEMRHVLSFLSAL